VGNHTANVNITGNNGANVSIAVSFEVLPASTFTINAAPASYNFGIHQAGYTTRPPQTITIANTGTGAVTLNALPGVTNWTLTPGSNWDTAMNPGDTRTFTVRPDNSLSVGTHNAAINITGSGGASVVVNVSFEVTVLPAPSLSATPGTLNFGSHAVGYTQRPMQTVTITNSGNTNITLNPLPTVSDWTLVPGAVWNTEMAPGDTRTFTVRPNNALAVGTYTQMINVTGSGGVSVPVQVSFNVSDAGTPSFMLGDVSGDGRVTVFDIILVRLYLAGHDMSGFTFIREAADMNGDGTITTADVILLRQLVSGN